MKSIVKIKSEKMLLSVNIADDVNTRINDIAQALGVTVKAVGKDSGSEQLGYLLGFSGFKASAEEKRELNDSCIVFSGITPNELNALLKALREAGIIIPLKAVCTPYNQSWKLADLVKELAKEHELMNGGNGGE